MKNLIFILLATILLAHSAIAGEVVKNDVFGFEVTLPDGWLIATAEDYYENLAKVKTEDPEFQKLLVKYANAPLVMAMKHAEPYSDVNPSFKINARPYGAVEARTGTDILNIILPGLKQIFTDLDVATSPETVFVGGKPAGHTAINYTLMADDLKLPVTSEMWIIPDDDYFYMIGVGYKQDETTGKRDEAISPVATLQFTARGED